MIIQINIIAQPVVFWFKVSLINFFVGQSSHAHEHNKSYFGCGRNKMPQKTEKEPEKIGIVRNIKKIQVESFDFFLDQHLLDCLLSKFRSWQRSVLLVQGSFDFGAIKWSRG